MQRKASAVWRGDVKSGQGSLSTESGVLEKTQYSFSARFENGTGTNPEELLAAEHAGCFAMAVSAQLGMVNLAVRRLDATATVTFEKVSGHHAITKSHLDLSAQVPGATPQVFDAAVKAAETGGVPSQNSFVRKSPWMRTLTRRPEGRGELAVEAGSRAGL